jgi:HPt (histidine-containing phosphotransfer) domain-containing protein
MGDRELAALLFQKFHARLREQLDEIDRCLAAQDLPAAQSRAHSLKGEAGSLSAIQLHAAAAALQDALRQNRTDNVQSLVARLRAEAEKCFAAYPTALEALVQPASEKNN